MTDYAKCLYWPVFLWVFRGYRKSISILESTGHSLTTGKEFLLKALETNDMHERTKLLERSFELGFKDAGTLLYKIYGLGDESSKKENYSFLAAGGFLPACIKLAELYNLNIKKKKIGTNGFGYLKIAASQHDINAISKIADLLFEDGYDYNRFLVIDQSKHSKYSTILIDMCEYLISNKEKPMKYKGYLGIVQFVNKEYANSFNNLRGCSTPASHYCKGFMYENGLGTAKSLLDALNEYEKCPFKYGSVALNELKNKMLEMQKQVEIDEEDGITDYKSGADYKPATKTTTNTTSNGCFITTAACRALKSQDNCEELEILRRFRDQHICDSNSGQELVYEYYRIGPMIVEKIDSQPDAQKIYDDLWTQYIYPSYDEIKKQDWNKAKIIYISMVKKLCERFGIQVDEKIAKRYSIELKQLISD